MASNNGSLEVPLEENPPAQRLEDHPLEKIPTDITIKVGEEEFHAHRNILEDSSPVLKAMLSGSRENVYHLDSEIVDSEIMEDLLSYFYTTKFTLISENAHAICMAAHFLQIPALLSASETFLSERVSLANVLDLLLLSTKLQLKTLFSKCVNWLFENYEIVREDVKFFKFLSENFEMIMKKLDEPRIPKMKKELMFEWLIKWTENNYSARSPSLPFLLECLPLHEFSLQFLNEVVATQKIIRESLPCSRLLIDALKKVSMDNKQRSKTLYCFGGRTRGATTSVSRFNTSSGQWAPLIRRTATKSDLCGAVIENAIYLCGGFRTYGFPMFTQMFHCPTNTWRQLEAIPERRMACAAAALDGFLYVAGGADCHIKSASKLSSVFRYDVQANEWQSVKPMNEARCDHQLVELIGRLYAINGRNSKTVEEYNPITDEWRMVASTQYRHFDFGATSLNGKIYVCSHLGFEVYSPDSNTWTALPPLNKYYARTLVSMKDNLWAIGGAPKGGPETASVYSFDSFTGQWTQLPDMDVARHHHCSFVVNDLIC